MTSKYTNKNGGKKLLAAMMAIAVVLVAGIIVFNGDEGVDATPIDDSLTVITGSTVIAGDTSYIADKDVTATLGNSATATIYVKDGVTLTLTGGTNSAAVTIYAADSTGKIHGTSDVILNGMTDGSISVKADYVADRLYISGNPTNTSLSFTGGSKVSIIPGERLILVTTVAGIDCGALLTDNSETGKYIYYNEGVNLGSITLDTGDSLAIYDASVILNDATGTLNINNVKSTTLVASQSTGLTGSVESGKITVSTGYVKTVVGLDLSGVSSGSIVKVKVGSNYYLVKQITSKVLTDDDVTEVTVYGKLTQSADVTSSAITSLTVPAGCSLIIPEGKAVSLTGATIAATGDLRVFGSLTATSATGNVYLGPTGCVSSYTLVTKGNTNLESGTDTGIGGTPLVSSVTDAILSDNLLIPAGTTFTIDGNLGLNGKMITVYGTLVISEGASIFSVGTPMSGGTMVVEGIVLASGGSIVNNGTIAREMGVIISDAITPTSSVTMTNISGIQIGYSGPAATVLSVGGDVVSSGGVTDSVVKINKVEFIGDVTIDEDIILDVVAADSVLSKDSTLSVGGTLTSTGTKGLIVGEGASLTIDGVWSITTPAYIQIKTGTYSGAVLTPGTSVNIAVTLADTKGLTFYSQKVEVDSGYELHAFIDGTLTRAGDSDTATVTVTGQDFYVAEGKILSIGSNTSMVVNDKTVIVDGTVVIPGASIPGTFKYVGAAFSVTTTSALGASETTSYIMSLSGALDIAKTQKINTDTVTFNGETIDGIVEVPKGITLKVIATDLEITEGSVLTVYGNITAQTGDGIDEVNGALIVASGSTVAGDLEADTLTILTDGTKVYANLQYAINNAGSEPVKTQRPIVRESDLTIRSGVTVEITESLTMGEYNLTVEEGATLLGGTISFAGASAEKKAIMSVAGTVNLYNGALDEGTLANFSMEITGEVILASVSSALNGAYYIDDSDRYIHTTVPKAVESGKDVTITGEVEYKSPIVIEDAKLSIKGDKVVLGVVELKNAQFITNNITTVDIVALGEGGVDSEITIVDGQVNVVAKEIEVTGGIEYAIVIDAISGEMTIVSGVIEAAGVISAAADSEFTVSEDAEFIISGQVTIDNATASFVSEGIITVDGKLTLGDSVKAIIADAQINGALEAKILSIAGDVVIDEDGSFTVVDGGVLEIGSLDADAASVNGLIKTTNTATGSQIWAYYDVDLNDLIVKDGASVITPAKFFVNGSIFATIYDDMDTALTINTSNIDEKLDSIVGVEIPNTIVWKKSTGQTIADSTEIGDITEAYLNLSAEKIEVIISVEPGIQFKLGPWYYTETTTESIPVGSYAIKTKDLNGSQEITVGFFIDGVAQEIVGGEIVLDPMYSGRQITISAEYATEPVGPSENMKVLVESAAGGVEVTIFALDGKSIPAGTLKITYSKNVVDPRNGNISAKNVTIDVPVEGSANTYTTVTKLIDDTAISTVYVTFEAENGVIAQSPMIVYQAIEAAREA